MYSLNFWKVLDEFLRKNKIIVDKPKNSLHPKYRESRYPVDYGYLKGTFAIDGDDVDVFIGNSKLIKATGILCTVDLIKKSCEMKILSGCSNEETKSAYNFFNKTGMMKCILINRVTNENKFNSTFLKNEEDSKIYMSSFVDNKEFWRFLQKLVDESNAKKTEEEIYKNVFYGLNFVFLDKTINKQKKGITAAIGEAAEKSNKISAIACVVNTNKKEAENIILLNCLDRELIKICSNLNKNTLISGILIKKE
ncbi:MAG: hypothetical protein LBT82_00480 [Oscillospiraceae bacterium]|nr:hypothetical protein [Oscillospiraceae bacterium]